MSGVSRLREQTYVTALEHPVAFAVIIHLPIVSASKSKSWDAAVPGSSSGARLIGDQTRSALV
jgi:hypothetical protein